MSGRGLGLLIGTSTMLFFLLTFLQARSWRVTGIFLAGLVGAVLVFVVFALMVL
ncbi:MAG: hypothetical protein HC902_06215, partial [Calothrix sp. SM1_5_4]|nr:hypothetical protein [Calothrix sp. SM1_5_4]